MDNSYITLAIVWAFLIPIGYLIFRTPDLKFDENGERIPQPIADGVDSFFGVTGNVFMTFWAYFFGLILMVLIYSLIGVVLSFITGLFGAPALGAGIAFGLFVWKFIKSIISIPTIYRAVRDD